MDQAGRGDDVEQWIARAAVRTRRCEEDVSRERGRRRGRWDAEDAKKIDRAKDFYDAEDGSR